MNSKAEFINGAIADTQSTIRSIDAKVGALIAGLLLPLSVMDNIWTNIDNFRSLTQPIIGICLILLFFMAWLLTFIILVRTILAIDDPAKHIVNSADFTGSFYSAASYSFSFIDTFLNRSLIKADKDVVSLLEAYPSNSDEIAHELAFEHLKLIYIRDIKFLRLNKAVQFAAIWFIAGLIIYFYPRIF